MSTRTTQQWQAADAAHFLHPFTDFQSLAKKGSRIVERADNIYLWDTDGKKILDAMPDGTGAVMIDGKMQDDATWKQAKVVVDLAKLVSGKDPDLAARYGL